MAEPWTDASFIDTIVTMQRQQQEQRSRPQQEQADSQAGIEIYDRSPVCTLALATHLGYPVSAMLAAELDRIRRERVYRREVFFVRNLGFCEPTAARRIGFEESLAFERIHEATYRDLGFEIVEVPAAGLDERVDLVADLLAEFAAAAAAAAAAASAAVDGRDQGRWT